MTLKKFYTRSAFASEVYGHDIVDLMALLDYKKCLLIEGAVGTGKTFTAKRLAWAKCGEINVENILYIKMNDGITYEDMMVSTVKEIDPVKKVERNVIKYGLFADFCIKASNKKDAEFFVILDDIDKCDIRKVFGTALGFFEKSCRNELFIPQKSKKPIGIPSNLYIIATRNLPKQEDDVDYSLMRIFTHYKAEPAFKTGGFRTKLQGMDNTKMNKLVKVIMDMNEFIISYEGLGEAYQIGHSYFCSSDSISNQDVQNIALTEIVPIIKSYWRNDKKTMDSWVNKVQVAVQDMTQKRV